jgi:hypothetical protein
MKKELGSNLFPRHQEEKHRQECWKLKQEMAEAQRTKMKQMDEAWKL